MTVHSTDNESIVCWIRPKKKHFHTFFLLAAVVNVSQRKEWAINGRRRRSMTSHGYAEKYQIKSIRKWPLKRQKKKTGGKPGQWQEALTITKSNSFIFKVVKSKTKKERKDTKLESAHRIFVAEYFAALRNVRTTRDSIFFAFDFFHIFVFFLISSRSLVARSTRERVSFFGKKKRTHSLDYTRKYCAKCNQNEWNPVIFDPYLNLSALWCRAWQLIPIIVSKDIVFIVLFSNTNAVESYGNDHF